MPNSLTVATIFIFEIFNYYVRYVSFNISVSILLLVTLEVDCTDKIVTGNGFAQMLTYAIPTRLSHSCDETFCQVRWWWDRRENEVKSCLSQVSCFRFCFNKNTRLNLYYVTLLFIQLQTSAITDGEWMCKFGVFSERGFHILAWR